MARLCDAWKSRIIDSARAIITHSWFETALDYKPRVLDPKIEEFPCLVHRGL